MTTYMIDATHANLSRAMQAIRHAQVVAIYVTGSTDIEETKADIASLPEGMPVVTIDQAGPGSPVPGAIVRDVESGAWTVEEAVKKEGWEPSNGRRCIYCSPANGDKLDVLGWDEDVWIVAESPVPYVRPGLHIVAQQYLLDQENGTYDVSQVYDPTWPVRQDAGTPVNASCTVLWRVADIAFGAVSDADHYVIKVDDQVIGRVPAQSPDHQEVHLGKVQLPGTHGGTLTISPIVHSKPVRVATIKLP